MDPITKKPFTIIPEAIQTHKKRSGCGFNNILKIAIVALSLLGFAAIPTQANVLIPTKQLTCPRTPPYVSQMIHNGFHYFENPKILWGYALKEKTLEDPQKTTEDWKYLEKLITHNPGLKEIIKKSCNDPTEIDDRGYGMFRKIGDTHYFKLCYPKPLFHAKAMNLARNFVANFGSLSSESFSTQLLELHNRLFSLKFSKDTVLKQVYLQFRNLDTFVFTGTIKTSELTYKRALEEIRNIGGNAAATTFTKGFARLKINTKKLGDDAYLFGNALIDNYSRFTAKEKAAISHLGMAPTPYHDIKKQLTIFSHEIQSKIKLMNEGQDDPLEIAAFAHMEIARIHPFNDGNGRTARLIMNAILMEAGLNPIVFPDDEEYTQALEANEKEAGAFARFLATVAKPWTDENIKKGLLKI